MSYNSFNHNLTLIVKYSLSKTTRVIRILKITNVIIHRFHKYIVIVI